MGRLLRFITAHDRVVYMAYVKGYGHFPEMITRYRVWVKCQGEAGRFAPNDSFYFSTYEEAEKYGHHYINENNPMETFEVKFFQL